MIKIMTDINTLIENWKKNKGKTYRKTKFRKMKSKFVSMELPLVIRLEDKSKETWISQSYIIAEALRQYLDNY